MLHYLVLGFATVTLLFVMPIAAQADEYGERFYNHTPAGMADYTVPSQDLIAMDDMAASLQDIMPAAGEEMISDDASDQAQNQANDAQEQSNSSVE